MENKQQPTVVFTDRDILKFLNKIYKTSNRYKLTVEDIKLIKQISDKF
jgi:hypothetical protein